MEFFQVEFLGRLHPGLSPRCAAGSRRVLRRDTFPACQKRDGFSGQKCTLLDPGVAVWIAFRHVTAMFFVVISPRFPPWSPRHDSAIHAMTGKSIVFVSRFHLSVKVKFHALHTQIFLRGIKSGMHPVHPKPISCQNCHYPKKDMPLCPK